MKTTSVQLEPEIQARLRATAKKIGVSTSRLIRTFVEQGLRGETKSASALDIFGDLAGHFEGPKDLSSRKAFETYPDDKRHAKNAH